MEPNKNLRVSTITLISEITSNINLNELYTYLNADSIIKYIEYGKNPPKGESVKKIKNPRKNTIVKEKKFFYNQLTMHVLKDKIVNVKVFNNGRIQMTGLKTKQQGIDIMNIFIDYLLKIDPENLEKIVDNTSPEIKDSQIVLINSDFDIKYKINRELLHRMIISMNYYSSYEPTIYPGVNIKYCFNESNPDDGICKCSVPCNGKGKVNSDGIKCCKRITIAVFNSGKIIITGGQSYHHLNTAYEFITNLIETNKKELIQNDKIEGQKDMIVN